MVLLIGALALVVLIVLAIPIGFALGMAGVIGIATMMPMQVIEGLMTKVVHVTAANYIILTIPMFILMAEFLGAGGVSQDLLLACNKLMRKVRGGMAIACVLAGAVLASASGSSTASAASITRAAFPVMKRAGYRPSMIIGTVSICGTLAIMIPPSITFVLYGVITENSIGKLFVAGILPGILTACGYILTILILLKVRPELRPDPKLEAKLLATSGNGRIWPIALLIGGVIAALYTGAATPTEVSAIGAFGALVLSLALGRMKWLTFNKAVGNTLRTTAMIVTIIFSAHLFGYFISFSHVTDIMIAWVAESGFEPTAVMLLVVAIYIFLGMIMDQGAIIILTAPITAPLMVGLGYDPIWWGVVMIKTAEIGLVSPPMGLNVYVSSSAAGVDLRDGFRGVMPFIMMELVILGLLLAFPQISLLFVN